MPPRRAPPSCGTWKLEVSKKEIKTKTPATAKQIASAVKGWTETEIFESLLDTQPNRKTPTTESDSDSDSEISDLELSDEQKYALYLVLDQYESVFITECAGTGKTVLLNRLIKLLRKKYEDSQFAVTATTNKAARCIDGLTIHKFAGIGFGQDDAESLVWKVRDNEDTVKRWQEVEILLIDEISMLKTDLFESLNTIAQRIRNSDKPFGGIQLVLCGDFLQLLPYGAGSRRKLFNSKVWKECVPKAVNLTHVHRQSDNAFIKALNELRLSIVSKETEELIRALRDPPQLPRGAAMTQIFGLRANVEEANKRDLMSNQGTTFEFKCKDVWHDPLLEMDNSYKSKLNETADEVVSLKVNSKVALTRNIDDELITGVQGVVVAFIAITGLNEKSKSHRYPPVHVESSNKRVKLEEEATKSMQNKSQAAFAHPGRQRRRATRQRFEPFVEPEIIEIIENLPNGNLTKHLARMPCKISWTVAENLTSAQAKQAGLLPLVKFATHKGVRFHLVRQKTLGINYEDSWRRIASRSQLPLTLAKAMTIHKAQGQTIPHLEVDLAGTFANGHVYVALSRATSMDCLQVHNFNSEKVTADEDALAYYRDIPPITEEEKALGRGKYS